MMGPTSTSSGLNHINGTFDTLADALDYAAAGHTGVNFYDTDLSAGEAMTYGVLRTKAQAMAARLAARFDRGCHIGLIAETSSDFLVAFMACQYAGMISAPMSLPAAFGKREAYSWQIGKIIKTANLTAVMAPESLKELLQDIVANDTIAVLSLNGSDLGQATREPQRLGADEPAYLQFSSGSTSDPKGVYATQKSVMSNVYAIINEGLKITHEDRMASWLPFYHDMGLVGFFLVPLCSQNSIDYISPSTFARRPGLWLRMISQNRCTIVFSPSFGYGLASRRYRGEELDLSCLRVAGIGGDMIEHDVLDGFSKVFKPLGFRHEAFVASYGMAEATLAISFAPLDHGPKLDRVGLVGLQTTATAYSTQDATEQQRTFTACGVPLPSMEVRILNASGACAAPREIGEIMLKGPSLAQGYVRDTNDVTPLCDEDGWFATGDLGYWLDDNLVITGRSKDLMLWNGKNIWPQDLEWVAQKAGGKHVARAAAFDFQKDDGTSEVVLLVECGFKDPDTREEIKRDIVTAVRNVAGVPFRFLFVTARSLPITSSGKLSRAGARLRYLGGELTDPIANDDEEIAAEPKTVLSNVV